MAGHSARRISGRRMTSWPMFWLHALNCSPIAANEPLPVGIIAAGASDGATITIEGLPDGADLSFGSRSDHSGWTLTVADLEHSFIGAPTGFVGIMEPTATLRSVSGKLLDRQALHFEWRARKGDPPVTSSV